MKDLIKNIIKEETEDMDKGLLNFLKRRAQIDVTDLSFGDDEKPFVVKKVSFNIDGEWYNINSLMSKKEMTWKLLNMLEDNNQINFGGYNPNILDPDRQKVVRTIKYFIDVTIRTE